MELETLVENLVKKLVSEPDQVTIKATQGDKTLVFEVRVSKQDMGRLIGRKGKTIEAIRTIINACGVKHDRRCLFQLVDDEE